MDSDANVSAITPEEQLVNYTYAMWVNAEGLLQTKNTSKTTADVVTE